MKAEEAAHTRDRTGNVRCTVARSVIAEAATSLALMSASATIAVAAPIEETAGEPANVGDAKTAAIAYHDSGAYAKSTHRR
ncbi:MAG TPA: hypothetical protein VMU34_11985 [Mycobacterium sp.]|nr:hypothetical protein [Mycobacterium sp.]